LRKQGRERLSSGGHSPFITQVVLSQVVIPKEGTAMLIFSAM